MFGERVVPHSDGAGIIDAVGDGVPADRVGERVWIWNAQWQRTMGTAAEYIAISAERAVTLPANVDFAAGACLGIPAMTGFQAVPETFRSRSKPCEPIFTSCCSSASFAWRRRTAEQ